MTSGVFSTHSGILTARVVALKPAFTGSGGQGSAGHTEQAYR
jgi:hypothetical protein